MSDFRLAMISAGFEHGGNVTHRHFDGHPDILVYPFESQLGNRNFNDFLASVERVQYRYPEFPEGLTAAELYEQIIDEEMKKAESLVKKGIPVAKVYDEIIKNGKVFEPLEAKVNDFKFDANTTSWGDPNKAKIVITEFSDFQCPFCSRVNGTLKQILDTYGDKVKIVWRHKPLPFHKDAPLAHQAAHEAFVQKGSKAFWAFHDKLFAGQRNAGMKRSALETVDLLRDAAAKGQAKDRAPAPERKPPELDRSIAKPFEIGI